VVQPLLHDSVEGEGEFFCVDFFDWFKCEIVSILCLPGCLQGWVAASARAQLEGEAIPDGR
jgi:hypothetical protein